MLANSYSKSSYSLDTNVRNKQFACVLLLDQPRQFRELLEYWFRTVMPAETEYKTTQSE